MNRRFVLNHTDAKLMGVGAGLADMTGTDPLVIRLAIILAVLVTGPVAAVLYVAAGVLAPQG
ncbi:phage shock protein C [Sphingomonas kaistensis]|uniref:Phage shock protein C n=1 Tax=Sphingomonas kaistensis TaxID=298708 RepID=A0A7X6BGB1_9SPHN|nr:PspC domain-containing protein [Sphingomonas kaistensis]NJC04881.1 phage shock protein C [Sphingomonas kaistensis]